MSKFDAEMLASLIDYKLTEPSIRDLPAKQFAAYNRETVARSRAAAREAKAAGIVEPTTANINQALADAALMILAVGGPGAEQVRNALHKIFSAHPGTPMSIEAKARTGKLKPKLFKSS